MGTGGMRVPAAIGAGVNGKDKKTKVRKKGFNEGKRLRVGLGHTRKRGARHRRDGVVAVEGRAA
jgi:hypothetical protein